MTAEGRLIQECCDECAGSVEECVSCDDYDPCDDPYAPDEIFDCEWGCQEQSLIDGNMHGDMWDTLQNPVTLEIIWANGHVDSETKYKSWDFCRYDEVGDWLNNTFSGTGHNNIVYVHPYQYQWINNVYTKVYTANPYWKIVSSGAVDLATNNTLLGTYTNLQSSNTKTYKVS